MPLRVYELLWYQLNGHQVLGWQSSHTLHSLQLCCPFMHFIVVQVVGAVGWGNARLQIPTTLPQAIRALMASCMESDPQKRPDFEQIIVALRSIRQNTPAPPPAPKVPPPFLRNLLDCPEFGSQICSLD